MGPSWSGKTTLLGLCAGLDQPSSGGVELQQNHLERMNEDQLASVRNRYVGFIFQNFQLLPTLTAIENVMVPLELRGEKKVRNIAMEYLDKVGLAERNHHYPAQLIKFELLPDPSPFEPGSNSKTKIRETTNKKSSHPANYYLQGCSDSHML